MDCHDEVMVEKLVRSEKVISFLVYAVWSAVAENILYRLHIVFNGKEAFIDYGVHVFGN